MAKTPKAKPARIGLVARIRRIAKRALFVVITMPILALVLFAFVRPPITPYMVSEYMRLGKLDRDWVTIEDVSPHFLTAVVAAEDVQFCNHWGLDLTAIRAALADGGTRGGSTISQQTVKNLLLWQGRSWPRKALEAMLTPVMEAIWSKQRILEVYVNIAEFDTGVFGIEAAAQRYFGIPAQQLNANQSARLAMVLPNPKERNAADPRRFERERAAHIADGAATITKDSRSSCFQD